MLLYVPRGAAKSQKWQKRNKIAEGICHEYDRPGGRSRYNEWLKRYKYVVDQRYVRPGGLSVAERLVEEWIADDESDDGFEYESHIEGGSNESKETSGNAGDDRSDLARI